MNHRFSIFFTTTALLIIAGVLILLLSVIDPSDVSAFGLLGILVIIYLFFFMALVFMYRIIELLTRFFKDSNKSKDVIKQQKSRRKIPYIISTLALVPLFLISFNSLGQINILNLSLIVVFEVLAIFYIVKRV